MSGIYLCIYLYVYISYVDKYIEKVSKRTYIKLVTITSGKMKEHYAWQLEKEGKKGICFTCNILFIYKENIFFSCV